MVRFRLIIALLVCLPILYSCSGKYKVYQSAYHFSSDNGKPDYMNLDYWAAHPGKRDPSDSVPAPLRNEKRELNADVFFIHPTTFTKKKDKQISNAAIDDTFIAAKTDYSSILYQASVFNASCRIYAPRYRQAHIHNFFSKDKAAAEEAFQKAYEDIRISFKYYMQHWNEGRPIIIAGHSQGALMAERLLKEFFEGKELAKKLVAAYVIGWPVPKEYFTSLPMCKDSLQTACVVSWRTYRKGYIPRYLKYDNGNALATNPLTWTTTGEYASKKLNLGSVLTNFNKIFTHTTDARVVNGLLYVKKPRFPWSFLYLTRNYHIADINLFYMNLRDNIRTRTTTYIQQH